MRDLELTIEGLIGMSAMGGSVGVVAQELLAPQLEGQLQGAIWGAVAAVGVFVAWQVRLALRAVTRGPEAVQDRTVDSVRADRMNEPFAEVITRPGAFAAIGFATGSLLERSLGAPADGPILGLLLGFAMLFFRFALQLIFRSKGEAKSTKRDATAGVTKKRARGSEFFLEALAGAAAATGLCGAAGALLKRLYPQAVDADVFGILVGMVLYGVWLVIYARRP